ncbi:MAG: hypothetical protein ACRD9R_08940 [Pyrinomonadaceae bacterium]
MKSKHARVVYHLAKAQRLRQLASQYLRTQNGPLAQARIKQAEGYIRKARYWRLKIQF